MHQDLNNIPEGFQVPEGRVKPWGTGHAVLSCAGEIDGPFVVINSDDYYGTHAFKMAYDFLIQAQEDTVPAQYMMVGYRLENTLTDNGYVSRVPADKVPDPSDSGSRLPLPVCPLYRSLRTIYPVW